jgi:MFS family permease
MMRVADPRGRRRVLAGFACLGAWWGTWGALLPAIQQSAAVDDGELGTALLFVGLGALVSMRLTGTLIDRWGNVVLPVTLAYFATAGMLPGVAHGVGPLAGVLFVVGAGSGALDVAINTASVRYESITGQRVMNLAHAMFSVGVIAFAGMTGPLRAIGLGPLAILGLLACVLWTAALWLYSGRHTAATAVEPSPDQEAQRPWRWWWPPRRLALLGVLTGLAFLVESSWQNWSAVHLERDLSASAGVGALGPALFGASAAAGRFAGHWLNRRLRDQSLVRAGAVLAAGGTVLAALAPSIPLALTGIAGAGLGTAVCAPTLFGLAGRYVGNARRGAAVGTVTTLAYFGFVIAPAFVGLLAQATSLRVALASTAAAAGLLALGAQRAGDAAPPVGATQRR